MSSRKRIPVDIAETDVPELPSVLALSQKVGSQEARARSKARLRRMSCFRLRPHPLQPTDRHSDANVKDLMESIAEIGLQEPPLVALIDGEAVILAGHRRARAWLLLAAAGRIEEKMPVYIRTDLTGEEALFIMAAEYCHRREFTAVHTARIVGAVATARQSQLGRKPTCRELASVVPWEKSTIGNYLSIYDALQDPRSAPLVQLLDKQPLRLLLKASATEVRANADALIAAYQEGGVPAVKKAMENGGKGSASPETQAEISSPRSGNVQGYVLKLHIRAGMAPSEVEEALAALAKAELDLKVLNAGTG